MTMVGGGPGNGPGGGPAGPTEPLTALPGDLPGVDRLAVLPGGFAAGALAAGIKTSGRPDLSVVRTTNGPAAVAAVFTQHPFAAAPVRLSQANLRASAPDGDGGYGWLSEAMVQTFMNFAYKVRIDGGVKGGDLTDDDCPADEMVDVAKAVCAPICPDNSRPNNGCGGGAAPAPPAPGGTTPPGFPVIPGLPQIPGFQIPPGLQIPGLPNFGH